MKKRNFPPAAFIVIFLILSYFGLRLGFQFHNSAEFKQFQFSDFIPSYLWGLRFDLSILALLNLPILILLFFRKLFKESTYKKVLLLAVLICNGIPFFLSLTDMEYYAITNKRLSMAISSIENDVKEQAWQLIKYYWTYILLTLAWSFLLFKIICTNFTTKNSEKQKIQRAVKYLVTVLLMILAIRGGFQTKPLSTTHALSISDTALSEMSLNAPFFIYRSNNKLDQGFFDDHFFNQKEMISILKNNQNMNSNVAPFPLKGQNIVIIILESFALEFTGVGSPGETNTPFLDSLESKGATFFRNAFANNSTSIDAIPAILTGLPVLMEEHFITSTYTKMTPIKLGKIFSQLHYQNSFFHGGHNGTMYFDSFLRSLSIDNYFGFNEYPNPSHYDGQWGVPDHYFFDWFEKKLNESPKPFFTSIFSLSSHQPYYVPEEFESLFPQTDKHPLLRSIQYTDFSLKKFFEKAEKEDWFKNTLFVLTADHTASCQSEYYCHSLNRYRVPIIFYHGSGKKLPFNPLKVTQQADIIPTILDWLDVPQWREKIPPFGQSLLREENQGRAFYQKGNSFRMIEDNYYYSLRNDGTIQVFNTENNKKLRKNEYNEEISAGVNRIKAYYQYFFQSLKQGHWIDLEKP